MAFEANETDVTMQRLQNFKKSRPPLNRRRCTLARPVDLEQCQLNKEPGQETQAKRLNFGHVIKMHG